MIHIDLMFMSMISVLAPTILAIAIFKYLDKGLKLVAFFVFTKCFLEAIAYVTFLNSIPNMPLYHLYTYVEFGFIAAIFYYFYLANPMRRRLIIVLSSIFLVISLYSLISWEFIDQFNSIQRATENVLLLVLLILFALTFLRSTNMRKYQMLPYYILTLGLIIYFTVTFLVFLNANEYIQSDQLSHWSVHSVSNIFLNAMYFSVLWTGGKRQIKLGTK